MLIKQIEGLSKSKIEDKKIELKVNIEGNVPEYLCGDSIRIKQIILGVLYNAVKYTKVGEINFNVGCITIGNICRLIITIKDTGIGIYEDKLETIFSGKIIDNQELTSDDVNINLPTIKDMLKSMNGQITIESEYKEGTTVTLVIAQKLGSNKEEESTEEKNIMKDFSGKKVLIVDDDRINLKVASRLLSSYKVTVDEAIDGFDCITKIQNGEHFDLIFLDDWMPKISGVETLKRLDEIKEFNTPVVALTANATPEMRDKYIKDGFNDYIPKPIERKELDRVIDKYLNDNE
jgi:CheY-like chemotaxis protein